MVYPISLISPAQNEETWLEISTRSVIHLVDEILFFDDNSVDRTREIAFLLSEEFPNFKIIPCPEKIGRKRFSSILNKGFELARNEWVMHWAPDFIAYTEGEHAIQLLFDKVLYGNEWDWDAIVFSAPNVSGDIFHYSVDPLGSGLSEFAGPEPYIWRKGHFNIFPGENYPDQREPLKETRYCWTHDNHHFLHMNTLKPLEKLAYRKQMCNYLIRSDKFSNKTYWEWYAIEIVGLLEPKKDEIEEIRVEVIESIKQNPLKFAPYDFEKWGEHPQILMESEVWKNFNIRETETGETFLDYFLE